MNFLLRYCLLLHLLCPILQVNSQTSCDDTSVILKIVGKWHHAQDQLGDPGIYAGDKKEISRRIDELFQLVQETYPSPLGSEPSWYRSLKNRKHDSPFHNGPYPYGLHSFYSLYHCDKRSKELHLVKETGTWGWIVANHFAFFLKKQDTTKLNGRQLYLRARYKDDLNGMPCFESFNNGKALLFSRRGELPYTPVTRRQYLEMSLDELKSRKTKSTDQIMKTQIRSSEIQESEKQKTLEKIDSIYAKYPGKNREAARSKYLQDYRTDQQRRDETLQKSNDYYNREIKKYQDEWDNTRPELLATPACILGRGNGILSDEKEGGLMLVTINDRYINKSLPATVPQFFVLIWTYTENNIASRHFNKELETKFPYKKLYAMIDK